MWRWMLFCLGCVSCFSFAYAGADCQTHYDGAVNLLQGTKIQIQNKAHPNPDSFAQAFQKYVERMQAEKCTSELKSLMEYIKDEQKKYPAEPGKKPLAMPIMD